MSIRAIFLDRDGVINHNHGYVHKRDNFDFIDGIFDLSRCAHEKNYRLVVITNQSGIGRGYFSEHQFHRLTDWMCQQFTSIGAPITRVYFSPYHLTAGLGRYKRDDFSRKPHPGMILQAKEDLSLDLKRSVLIGDKVSDIQAGVAAGVGTNLLFGSGRPTALEDINYEVISTLNEAIPYLQRKAQ